jgi:hypothetical protein
LRQAPLAWNVVEATLFRLPAKREQKRPAKTTSGLRMNRQNSAAFEGEEGIPAR